MREHGMPIFGDEDSLLAFGPGEYGWIVDGERQVGRIADANYVEQVIAAQVMPQHGLPQRAAEVFVQDEGQRHALTDLRFVRGGVLGGEAAAEGVQVEGPCALLRLVCGDRACRDVGIDVGLVVEVEGDYAVDEGKRQGWISRSEHLRRVAIVVVLDHMVQPDPMAREPNFTVRRLSEEFRKLQRLKPS